MNGTFQFRTKKALLLTALAAGASITGLAHADDSSMNPFTGESYAAFSGGYNRPTVANPTIDNSPSAWREANPSGLSERVLQSYSAPGVAWQLNAPTFARVSAAADFRETHPNGLSERELQALSSDGPAWQLRGEPGTGNVAAEAPTTVSQSSATPLSERLAAFFHRGATTAQ
jgi:hypothetical protein